MAKAQLEVADGKTQMYYCHSFQDRSTNFTYLISMHQHVLLTVYSTFYCYGLLSTLCIREYSHVSEFSKHCCVITWLSTQVISLE